MGGGNAIGDLSAVTVGSGLLLNDSETIGSLSGGGEISGGSTLTTGANNTSTAFSGFIGGGLSLTKVGSGTQTLSGANDYTGATTVTMAPCWWTARSSPRPPSTTARTLGGNGTAGKSR